MGVEPKLPGESGSDPSSDSERANASETVGIGATAPYVNRELPSSLASDGNSDDRPAEAETGPLTDSNEAGTSTLTSESSGWGNSPQLMFQSGRVVFEKYRLIEKLGEGGMGEVWKVHNIELERTSALKLIKPEIAQNDKGWARFQREARLMAKLHHPNVVGVYDFKRTRSMGYIEMEFVNGRSLDQVLAERNGQPLPLDRIVQIVDQLCSVLEDAHSHADEKTGKSKPIIHRDLKPSNLMLVDRKPEQAGEVQLKVLDFGIAKTVEDDGSPVLTDEHDIIGTPSYMSPEQIKGGFEQAGEEQALNGRSDLYSTGVVLYHLLTGTLPFRGNKMEMLAAHLHKKPIPMTQANPRADIPRGVERVVMQCLEKEPDKRPQSARELAENFRRAAGLMVETSATTRSRSRVWRRVVPAVVVTGLAAATLAAIVVALRAPPGRRDVPKSTAGETTRSTSRVTAPGAIAETPSTGAPSSSGTISWIPTGFSATPTTGVDERTGLAKQLRRADGAVFDYYTDGLYLPAGYTPEGPGSTSGRWPKTIVRRSDAARFIRIDGGTFVRGDPRREQGPALDVPGNPLTPHFVRVEGFYIQETEVTNGEIQSYLEVHPDDEINLRKWREAYEYFRTNNQVGDAQMGHYPAVCVGYDAARRYANWVGGELATEAQWEYAAKSFKGDSLFAWGNELPPAGERWANLDNPQWIAAPVKSSEKDRTVHGVYDMTGNVRELCADVYKPYDDLRPKTYSLDHPLVDRREDRQASSEPNPVKIVVRGGSYGVRPRTAMSFMRDRLSVPGDMPGDVGFRLVIECPSHAEALHDDRP
jgi:eukaryotic-like serine/threonine-protein kinase